MSVVERDFGRGRSEWPPSATTIPPFAGGSSTAVGRRTDARRVLRGGAELSSVPATGEDSQDLADVGGVMAVGPLLEVAAQCGDCIVEPPDPAEQEAAIAAMIRVRRLDDGEQFDGPQGGRPVARGEVGRTEVSKDAGKDLALAIRSEHARMEQDPVADRPAQQRLAVVGGESTAVGRRIEEYSSGCADDEVTGQTDPDEVQADPPRDLEFDDRQ